MKLLGLTVMLAVGTVNAEGSESAVAVKNHPPLPSGFKFVKEEPISSLRSFDVNSAKLSPETSTTSTEWTPPQLDRRYFDLKKLTAEHFQGSALSTSSTGNSAELNEVSMETRRKQTLDDLKHTASKYMQKLGPNAE
mmetsp:Transcript_22225/g.35582  ORF Transcript_22225/g.35582 Transcript_22225/m.35582 type:complete len:137 (+) Transcript_22225:147-557(+)